MSELRKRMIRDMQSRNFSHGTQRAYLRAVAGLADYYHPSPDRINAEEIQDYIVHLFSESKLAVGNCALGEACNLLFPQTTGRRVWANGDGQLLSQESTGPIFLNEPLG